jgi:hypothetical protein
MTLIAFACYPDRIEAITDTASYTRSVTQLGQVTKQVALPHLDALVITQGDSEFGIRAKVVSLEASGEFATFDELANELPPMLRELWPQRGHALHVGTLFLLGYSAAEEQFVAWQYAAEHDFAPERVDRPFVTPSPFTMAPSALERERAATYLDHGQHHLLANWDRRPELTAPESTQDWLDLAVTVRQQRALEPFMRVIVAGRVFHTVLRRGRVTTRQIHQFDDHGDEFLQLIAWTQHPQAQLMECHCGSGDAFVDCHLAPYLDAECNCGSGHSFRKCCMVERVDTASTALAG